MPDKEIPIPTEFEVDTNVSGTLGSSLSGSVTANIKGDESNPLPVKMSGGLKITADPMEISHVGDPNRPVAALMTGDPNKPIATTVDIKNIPHLSISDIKDILTPRIRMHIPNYEQFNFKLFGVELFSMCMSGETQVVTEPYRPNRFERCDIECEGDDHQPFPEKTPTHGSSFQIRETKDSQ